MRRLVDWLDSRTGVRSLVHEVLFERIPGGARWRYVWGSTLTFCFAVQVITGIVLWMAYSPSATTAWESVYYIQHEMTGGWLLRGLHHFTAQAMHVLLVLHLLQVVIDGAYKAPREVNYWFGVALMLLTLGLGLTGYLLPWDQKGYGATKVATALMGITPLVGPALQKLVVGGTEYGNHTLTRFFALHAGVLPALMVAAVAAHVALFRRHGITAKQPLRRPEGRFWPDQVLMDGVACLAVMAAVLYLTMRHHGAELHAPADATQPFNAARPEWYFLFLFEFLKLEVLTSWFGHHGELVGAILVPGAVLGLLGAMPLLGNWRLGHRFNVSFLVVLLLGALGLTFRSLQSDARNAGYQAAVQGAREASERAVALIKANGGIPPSGAAALLRGDPATAGPRLFA
ncbi:MAG: cytochrome bc complex cytochrome b subunit, partial [Verrucomicrobiota bacterium]